MNYQDAVRTLARLQYLSAGGVPQPQVHARKAVYQSAGGMPTPHYISAGTGAGGREDNIPARLSENEYVWDAETVALLGDGNPDAGAKKLDAMREAVRRKKGRALAKGKISPDAGNPLEYLSAGGVK